MNTTLQTLVLTGLLLIIPAIGNRTVEGWNWSLFDFVWAGVMIAGVQFSYHYFAKKVSNGFYKMGAGIGLAATFIFLWINAAVGIVGDDDGINMVFFIGILATLVGGSLLSKASPLGMARTFYAVAAVVLLIPTLAVLYAKTVIGQIPGVVGVYLLCGVFAAVFVVAGTLFRKAVK